MSDSSTTVIWAIRHEQLVQLLKDLRDDRELFITFVQRHPSA